MSNRLRESSSAYPFSFPRLFPNTEFVWLEGKSAGHWIHEDRHEEFMQAAVPFLESER